MITKKVCRGYVPLRPGGYSRISSDPYGLERGVDRQEEDIDDRARLLKWGPVTMYRENDTSAFRKKRIIQPDGEVIWRVVRPIFAQMLKDLARGVIDGIIVWDQDRLLRQPRDLEDLIDLVEVTGYPIAGIQSSIDLMTSAGRAMARVMAAIANKSSEDTSARVQRARQADAKAGRVIRQRTFGRNADGTLVPMEAGALKWALLERTAGKSWSSIIRALQATKVRPLEGGNWNVNTLRNQLLNPMIAGIAVYRGALREEGAAGPNRNDPMRDVVTNADGSYVMADVEAIAEIEEWEALVNRIKAENAGKIPKTGSGKKYELSGFVRCGRVLEDGRKCMHGWIGTPVKKKGEKGKAGETYRVYKCPTTLHGGCGRGQRIAVPLEELIDELFIRHLRNNAATFVAAPVEVTTTEAEDALAAARARLADAEQKYANGTLSGERFYSLLPQLEAQIKQLAATVEKEHEDAPISAPAGSVEQVISEWQAAAGDPETRRAILGRYLVAIEVAPSEARGRAPFDASTITPIWRTAHGTAA